MTERLPDGQYPCSVRERRAAMTDEDFWQDVGESLMGPQWTYEDAGSDLDPAMNVGLCDTCGADGACAYDSEGRALIHATEETP